MKNQRTILISLVAGFIIVILIAVLGTLLDKKPLNLYNIDQVESGLSGQQVGELEKFIWESLQQAQGFDKDTSEIVALVRPSSFIKTTKDNITNYDFIVDIDEFKTTYEVSFAMMKGEGFYEAPVVDCPAPSLMKYPDVKCTGGKTSTLSVTIGRSLPYYFNLSNGELVTVTRNTTDAGEEYLNVRVSACGDEAIITETKEQVEAWIKSLGYEPSDYSIKIPEFCDGEF